MVARGLIKPRQGLTHRWGFTLMEVLVAVAILLLVAAIAFPVLSRARKSGHQAATVLHLRQLGAAIELYRNDFDGQLPFDQLDPFVDTGYLRDRALLMARVDDFEQGYGRAMADCADQNNPTALNTSFETSLSDKVNYEITKQIDPGAAIVACRTFGQVMSGADVTCNGGLTFWYSGRILRLFEDLHVKPGNFSLAPRPEDPPGTGSHWFRYRLYTEVEPDKLPY